MLFLLAFIAPQVFGTSAGANAIDNLGICSIPTSGAKNDSNGNIFCPPGMHSVTPPTRTDAYTVRTEDGLPVNDPDQYVPDSIMDIHIRTHNRYMKYLGLVMYAIKDDESSKGPQGCPYGCDGKVETKVGSWELVDSENFRIGGDKWTITHAHAKKRRFHHVFRFKTPPAGTGPIIFRVLLKHGATNGGAFYWPMVKGDLRVTESPAKSGATPNGQDDNGKDTELVWIKSTAGETCDTACKSNSMTCDPNADVSLKAYEGLGFKANNMCKFPLLTDCSATLPTKDSDGFCHFTNTVTCATKVAESICDIKTSGDNRCPCERAVGSGGAITGGNTINGASASGNGGVGPNLSNDPESEDKNSASSAAATLCFLLLFLLY